MTDVTTYTPPAAAPAPFSAGGNLIREAAAVMADAHTLAKAICNTQMVPAHFRGKPDECAAAILFGASLGLDPMQALKGIYVVHGNAALAARTMASIVLRDGHELWTVESTDETVTVAGRRRGSERVEECTWTYARADRAGYTSNAKYKTDPRGMLYAKAVTEACRKIAPDSLSGVYAVEELELERGPSRPNTPGRGGAVSAATFTPVAPTPVHPEPETAAAQPAQPAATDEAPAPRTEEQAERLTELFELAGITDQAGQRQYIAETLPSRPDKRRGLTAAEADEVLACLDADLAGALDRPLYSDTGDAS